MRRVIYALSTSCLISIDSKVAAPAPAPAPAGAPASSKEAPARDARVTGFTSVATLTETEPRAGSASSSSSSSPSSPSSPSPSSPSKKVKKSKSTPPTFAALAETPRVSATGSSFFFSTSTFLTAAVASVTAAVSGLTCRFSSRISARPVITRLRVSFALGGCKLLISIS